MSEHLRRDSKTAVGAPYVVRLALSRNLARPWTESAAERANASGAVTASPALDIFPFVVDRPLAYSSDRSGRFQIYVRQLTPGGDEIQLTSDDGENLQPAWSPDGTRIAYYSHARDGIWIAPAFGGVARQLTTFGSDPAWSPDGQRIAFNPMPLRDVSMSGIPAVPGSTLWLVAADGGELRRLTVAGNPSVVWRSRVVTKWNSVAFLSTVRFLSLGRFPLRGNPTPLLHSHGLLGSDLFIPPGRRSHLAARVDRAYGLWRAPVGAPDAEPALVASVPPAAIRYPTISADGSKLAYMAMTMRSDIASVQLTADSYESAGEPVFLTRDTSERNTFPHFSPDGQTIAFCRSTQGGGADIWLMDANGENPRPVTSGGDYVNPHWFPDGHRLAFSSDHAIEVLMLSSVRIEPFSRRDADSSGWSLSPDAKTLAIASRRTGPVNVWTVAVGSDRERRPFDDEGGVRVVSDGRPLPSRSAWLRRPDCSGTRKWWRAHPAHARSGQSGTGSAAGLLTEQDRFAGRRPASLEPIVGVRDGTERITDYSSIRHYVRYLLGPRGDQIVCGTRSRAISDIVFIVSGLNTLRRNEFCIIRHHENRPKTSTHHGQAPPIPRFSRPGDSRS
jgi:Tol biopolymer transport system component